MPKASTPMADREQRNVPAGAFQPTNGPRKSSIYNRQSFDSYASIGLAFSRSDASITQANPVARPGTGLRGML